MLFAPIAFLSVVGAGSAALLYLIAKKLYVEEDPRIDQVNRHPAWCQLRKACGFPGCSGFAKSVRRCRYDRWPVLHRGGQRYYARVGQLLGRTAVQEEPKVAVVRCNGTWVRLATHHILDGAAPCAVVAALYGGETGCSYGCLGLGDCTFVCDFDAIHINPTPQGYQR